MSKQYRFSVTTDCNTVYNYSLDENAMINFLKTEIVANNNIELMVLVQVLFTFKRYKYKDKHGTLCIINLM